MLQCPCLRPNCWWWIDMVKYSRLFCIKSVLILVLCGQRSSFIVLWLLRHSTMLSQFFALFTAVFALGFVQVVCANTYRVQDTYIGDTFYNGFTAQAISDPTHGRVKCVSFKSSHTTFLLITDRSTATSARRQHGVWTLLLLLPIPLFCGPITPLSSIQVDQDAILFAFPAINNIRPLYSLPISVTCHR